MKTYKVHIIAKLYMEVQTEDEVKAATLAVEKVEEVCLDKDWIPHDILGEDVQETYWSKKE